MIVIFSDLDGTLIDHSTYSFKDASLALELIKRKGIPLVICSSKTRAEIEVYRRKMENDHPFISENGGGVYIPKGYFPKSYLSGMGFFEDRDYWIIQLGISYEILCRTLKDIEEELGCRIKGFNEMGVDEIARITNLSYEEAVLAKKREYDEPFIVEEGDIKKIEKAIKRRGFNLTKGAKLFHILGKSDKGKAVGILKEFFKKKYKEIITIGAGDGLNDLPLLNSVDYPVLIKKYDGSYEEGIDLKNIIRSEEIGPKGWNKAIQELILKVG